MISEGLAPMRYRATIRTFAIMISLLAVLAAPAARAQSAGDDAAPETLFPHRRKLMGEQKYAEACPKFQKSAEISPAVGTLLNLGECYERQGKMASAWGRYKAAENLAAKLKDKRMASAAQRASAVEPKLSRLTITVSDE